MGIHVDSINFSNNRSDRIDVMKGILMMFVVIGHAQAPFHQYIYLFHMSVFLMITGYLWKDDYVNQQTKMYIKKKFKTLWFPYVAINLVFLLLGIVDYRFYDCKEVSITSFMINILKIMLFKGRCSLSNTTWYIEVLFVISVLYFCLRKNVNKVVDSKRNQDIIITGVSVIVFVLGVLLDHFDINYYLCGTMCIAFFSLNLGYIARKIEVLISKKGVKRNTVIEFIVSFWGLVVLANCSSDEIRLFDNEIVNGFYYVISSVIGWIFVSSLSDFFIKIKRWHVFEIIGQKTMYILGFHFLAFKIVALYECIYIGLPKYKIFDYPVVDAPIGKWWILYSIIGIVVPFIFSMVIDKGRILLCKKVELKMR